MIKTIILAGGYGTRLGDVTDSIPKPMVEIGGIPIIVHLMKHYAHYGHTNFYIALGYKADYITKYFNNFNSKWNINLIDTGDVYADGEGEKIIGRALKAYKRRHKTFFRGTGIINNKDFSDCLEGLEIFRKFFLLKYNTVDVREKMSSKNCCRCILS